MDGHPLNYVKSFPYLGSKINQTALLDDEIANRISKASDAFGKLRSRVCNERGLRLKTKMSVYRAVIISILLYGSETWTPYMRHIQQFDSFHERCLRSICGLMLSDRVSNIDLFQRCDMMSIEGYIMQSQLRWAGHVVRMDDSRLLKTLTYCQLNGGKRSLGRPFLR